jgi:hypothetical protein
MNESIELKKFIDIEIIYVNSTQLSIIHLHLNQFHFD